MDLDKELERLENETPTDDVVRKKTKEHFSKKGRLPYRDYIIERTINFIRTMSTPEENQRIQDALDEQYLTY